MQETLAKAVQKLPFNELTPLQEKSSNCDTGISQIIVAPTGSGKTLAFLLAVFANWDFDRKGIQSVIVSPTRELALQIAEVVKLLKLPVHTQCVYGGHDINTEINRLSNDCNLLIGTPGRLIDLLHREAVIADRIPTIVFDEYDKLLELGFQDEIDEVLNFMQPQRFILSSATTPKHLPQRFKNFKFEEITGDRLVDISLFEVKTSRDERMNELMDMLFAKPGCQTIVFCELRDTVEEVGAFIEENGMYASVFHGGLEQDDRKRALLKFKNGSNQVLICTDLGARGLDIPQVELVVHFDLPLTQDQETHRNGRTGRMGKTGEVIYLVTDQDRDFNKSLPSYSYQPANRPPKAPKWVTIYFSGGKKQKIRKGDLLGYLTKDVGISGKSIGLIQVEDNASFVAIERKVWHDIKDRMRKQRVKNQRLKIEEAR